MTFVCDFVISESHHQDASLPTLNFMRPSVRMLLRGQITDKNHYLLLLLIVLSQWDRQTRVHMLYQDH